MASTLPAILRRQEHRRWLLKTHSERGGSAARLNTYSGVVMVIDGSTGPLERQDSPWGGFELVSKPLRHSPLRQYRWTWMHNGYVIRPLLPLFCPLRHPLLPGIVLLPFFHLMIAWCGFVSEMDCFICLPVVLERVSLKNIMLYWLG